MVPFKILFCVYSIILCISNANGSVIDFSDLFDVTEDDFTASNIERFFSNGVKFGPQENDQMNKEQNDRIADKFDIFHNDTFFPLVNTSMGFIRGEVMKSYFQRDFYAFKGIPFAKTLTKYFQNSEEMVDPLEVNEYGEYDATYFRAKCPQASMVTNGAAGRLDCLHLSIYTPPTILEELELYIYPVMVFIHGGGFISGDASLYIPTKMMDKDVIVVVVQYRLGSLGFLAAGTDSAPGNMGLMDQVIALRWVQNNIRDFNGDKSKVTVFGQSAGAASASWMMFTPLTGSTYNEEDLLKRVLAQSGSAIEVWTMDSDPQGSLYTHAEAVGCATIGTNDRIVSCMEKLDLDVIVKGFNYVHSDDLAHGGLGFKGLTPVIQRGSYFSSLSNDSLVIIEHPLISAKNGRHLQVDIMTGAVRDEGSLVAGLAWESFFDRYNLTDNKTFMSTEMLPVMIRGFGIEDITQTVANSIRLGFLRDAEMGNWDSMIGGMIDAFGMMFLKSGGWSLASLISNRSPQLKNIYIYSFEFESNDSLFGWYFMAYPKIPMNGGITHADDLLYLFHLPSYMNDDENQLQTIRRLTTLWANFAKYGNPTQPGVTEDTEIWDNLVDEWEPFTYENKKFMLIQDECHMGVDITLRWNYNSITEANATMAKFEEPVDIVDVSDVQETTNVSTIALAVTCSVLMLCIIGLAFKSFIRS